MRCPCYYASPGERSFFYPLVLVAVISVTVQPGYNEIQCRYYPWQEPYLSLSLSLSLPSLHARSRYMYLRT